MGDKKYPGLRNFQPSMYFVVFNICDIDFQFVEGGVVVDPTRHDLDDPAVIAALKRACLIHPWANKLFLLEEELQTFHVEQELKNISQETLKNYLAKANDLLEQPYIAIPAWLRDFHAHLSDELSRREALENAKKQHQVGRGGFVYLLQSPTGHFKIGRTKDPENRRATFGVKLPFPVEFIHLIACDDMHEMERGLHRRFAHRRLDGEWFALTTEDIDWIKSQ